VPRLICLRLCVYSLQIGYVYNSPPLSALGNVNAYRLNYSIALMNGAISQLSSFVVTNTHRENRAPIIPFVSPVPSFNQKLHRVDEPATVLEDSSGKGSHSREIHSSRAIIPQ
jgi:hypothetical protein